jgi:hypothetical protein
MQIGDLVILHGIGMGDDIGVIVQQVGVVDRWLVRWGDGTTLGHNGYTLEVICN